VKRVLPALFLACAVSRLAAADFTVTNTNNSGPGSLYQAITDANNTPGADRIPFNIPGSGVQKIDVSQNPLPTVSESLVIDGYSQPGAKPNTLERGDNAVILIQIDGGAGGVSATNGLIFYPGNGVSNYTVRGLCLTGFTGAAITAGPVYSVVVAGNFIGVLPDGETARGNHIGVGHATQVGGSDPASRNVISGNHIGFAGEADPAPGMTVYGATVQGNYIGTNASGTKAVPNDVGIGLETVQTGTCASADRDLSNTIIGGEYASGASNVISGNTSAITLGRFECGGNLPPQPVMANRVRITGNLIGVQPDFSTALRNGSGITVVAGSDNVIGGSPIGFSNLIAFNESGVIVAGGAASQHNQIVKNAIYSNGIGIDLGGDGVTLNDSADSDTGPNNLQNYPLINSVTISGSRFLSAAIAGTLNSTPNSTFRVDVYGNVTAGPSGFGQGNYHLGSINVTTDGNGNASFNVTVSTGQGISVMSATATDSSGNTSEFSPAFPPPAQLLNLSTRTAVGTGENVLICGFILVGTDNKKVMLRGLGPSLEQAGVSGALANPTLELHDSTGALLTYNDNWKDSQADEINATGLAPGKELESAILTSLAAKPASQGGAGYSAILAGKDGTTGIGLVEIYDLAGSANSKLANISTRGFVGPGDGVLIGGLIPGPTGRSPVRLLIRALGPSLAAHGINNPLKDPVLELHDANGNTLRRNDNWRDAFEASEISASGIAPTDNRESAILTTLLPANSGYTAVVAGVNGSTGVALVEVYALN
jgi:hypothetical protein